MAGNPPGDQIEEATSRREACGLVSCASRPSGSANACASPRVTAVSDRATSQEPCLFLDGGPQLIAQSVPPVLLDPAARRTGGLGAGDHQARTCRRRFPPGSHRTTAPRRTPVLAVSTNVTPKTWLPWTECFELRAGWRCAGAAPKARGNGSHGRRLGVVGIQGVHRYRRREGSRSGRQ